MDLQLTNKKALVTGASQGIGQAIAFALASQGADVAICARNQESLKQVAADIAKKTGRKVVAIAADLTKAADAENFIKQAHEALGRIDILVNNAGIFGSLPLRPFEQIPSDEFDAVMRVNVRGVFECSKAVAPLMRQQKYGKIVNIASGTVFKGTPMLMHYVASKGAVVAMTRCMAREMGNDGIRVNCIAPGLTMSESVRNNPSWSDDIIASNMASRALKREAVPEDMLGALIFLCSPESDFITGQTIVVDGGSVMH
jgi:NAD(P)-dependent dehydrogenase (short-subunit alcohol dehydrogenase family)